MAYIINIIDMHMFCAVQFGGAPPPCLARMRVITKNSPPQEYHFMLIPTPGISLY